MVSKNYLFLLTFGSIFFSHAMSIRTQFKEIKAQIGEEIIIKLIEGGRYNNKWQPHLHDAASLTFLKESYTPHEILPGPEACGVHYLTLKYKAIKSGQTKLEFRKDTSTWQKNTFEEAKFEITIEE
jgi:predicted secreted protein